jgi:hypothetical protein
MSPAASDGRAPLRGPLPLVSSGGAPSIAAVVGELVAAASAGVWVAASRAGVTGVVGACAGGAGGGVSSSLPAHAAGGGGGRGGCDGRGAASAPWTTHNQTAPRAAQCLGAAAAQPTRSYMRSPHGAPLRALWAGHAGWRGTWAEAAAGPHRQLENAAHGPRAGAHVHANHRRRRRPRAHGRLGQRLGRLRAQSRPRSASAVSSKQSQCKDHMQRSCLWVSIHTMSVRPAPPYTHFLTEEQGRTVTALGRQRREARRGSFGPCCCGGAACGAAARPPAAQCSTARCAISGGTWAGMPAARRARPTTCAASAL